MAAGLADTAKVELAYIIGQPHPCAINIELNNFGKRADKRSDSNSNLSEALIAWIREHIDLSPKGIIERFDGLRPRVREVTRQGHFGHSHDKQEKNFLLFPWEQTDIADYLQSACQLK